MKTNHARFLVLLGVLLAKLVMPYSAEAFLGCDTGILFGSIVNVDTGGLLSNATVVLKQGGQVKETVTASNGGYLATPCEGTYDVTVSKEGFFSQTRNGIPVTTVPVMTATMPIPRREDFALEVTHVVVFGPVIDTATGKLIRACHVEVGWVFGGSGGTRRDDDCDNKFLPGFYSILIKPFVIPPGLVFRIQSWATDYVSVRYPDVPAAYKVYKPILLSPRQSPTGSLSNPAIPVVLVANEAAPLSKAELDRLAASMEADAWAAAKQKLAGALKPKMSEAQLESIFTQHADRMKPLVDSAVDRAKQRKKSR